MDLKDKVVIVTGASMGIGLAIAKKLATEGAHLVLAARDARILEKASSQIAEAIAVPTDVTKPDQVRHLVDETIKKYGRIDILINNAAQAMAKPVEKIDIDEYRTLIELNVIAPLNLMQLVIPHMRAQGGGVILNMSSQASTKYIPFIAGYASTKFALNNLSLTAREELDKDNIVVSIIKPGIVDTEFGKHTKSPEPDMLRYSADGVLLPHVISVDAVADAAVDLLKSGKAELDVVK